jgi:hypothetical protein
VAEMLEALRKAQDALQGETPRTGVSSSIAELGISWFLN